MLITNLYVLGVVLTILAKRSHALQTQCRLSNFFTVIDFAFLKEAMHTYKTVELVFESTIDYTFAITSYNFPFSF